MKNKEYMMDFFKSRHFILIDRIPTTPSKKVSKKSFDKSGLDTEERATLKEFGKTMSDNNLEISRVTERFSADSLVARKGQDIGSYDLKTGKFIIDPDAKRETLLRSLLDCTSSHEYRCFTVRGFERSEKENVVKEPEYPNRKTHYGFGLNEGYKDVLLQRYFDVPNRYPELADMALLIEMIVGREKMESSFINGDLFEVARTLNREYTDYDYNMYNKYASKIIITLDDLYTKIYQQGLLGTVLSQPEFSRVLFALAKLAFENIRLEYRTFTCQGYVTPTKEDVCRRLKKIQGILDKYIERPDFGPKFDRKRQNDWAIYLAPLQQFK